MIYHGHHIGIWVSAHTGGTYCSDHSVAIGLFDKDDSILAGIIFEGYTGKSIVAHIAIKGRTTREFWWAIADYAFRQHEVNKVIAPTYSDNARMIDLAIHIGFELEAVIEDAVPNGDLYFLTLKREKCRFLEGRYRGKTQAA